MTTVDETFEPISFASSNLASASYEPDVENLHIEFNSGARYVYFNVPASVYRALTLAASAGQFFYRSIRSRYAYEEE